MCVCGSVCVYICVYYEVFVNLRLVLDGKIIRYYHFIKGEEDGML